MKPALKVHIHDSSRTTTTSASGIVMEAVCEHFKPVDRVVSEPMYRTWRDSGYTPDIFCGNCLQVIDA